MIVIFGEVNSAETNRIYPEAEGARPFHWDRLKGEIIVERDDFEQPESLVLIRDEEEGAPATVALTGTSGDLAEASLRRTLDDLRLPMV